MFDKQENFFDAGSSGRPHMAATNQYPPHSTTEVSQDARPVGVEQIDRGIGGHPNPSEALVAVATRAAGIRAEEQ